jgi:hypothetical protein
MNVNSDMILSYLNSSITEAEIENAKKYNLDLSIIKFEMKDEESQKYKNILKFIDTYFDFLGIVPDTNNSFLIFARNIKLHAVVLMVKNLNLALKLNFSTELKNVAITSLDKYDKISDIIERLNRYFMKAKLTKKNIYYGTRSLDFNDSNVNVLKRVFEEDRDINIYGLFYDAPIKIEAQVKEVGEGYTRFTVAKKYLSFLQKQPVLYFEHTNVADVFSASVFKIDYENDVLEVGDMKFVDHSPIHRKQLRVAPVRALKATLSYENFAISGFISDLSVSSILFTTEIQNIDELQKEDMLNKTFTLVFELELFGNSFDIDVKATIFRTKGNQLVLNIFADSETQKIINEYINMSYQQLLLQVQGKVV